MGIDEDLIASNSSTASREERVSALVAAYVDRLNRRTEIDPEEIRRKHSDVAEEVLEQLEVFVGVVESPGPDADLGSLGDYALRREIGRGGMGVVYEAWEGSIGRRVALKVLPPGVAADHKAFRRFLQEGQATGRLSHPNVVAIHAMGQIGQTPYYAMDFVEGETLAQILARTREAAPGTKTPFGPKDQVDYFAKVARTFAGPADGLQHAHSRGVVHRDIKPSNLILDGDGRLRILDFGLARFEGQESLTASGDVVGTPLYMSPEQARRRRVEVDHRTDIYSAGATLYEVLAGRPPFRGKDHHDTLSQIVEREPVAPRKLNPRVPRDLETIVLKCLRKDPGNRYGTAEALAQDLRRFVRGDPVEAKPPSSRERLGAALRRHRTRIIISAIALASLSCIGWLALESRRARLETQRVTYERAVLGVVKRIYADKISFSATAGNLESLLTLGGESFSPVAPEDFKALLAGGGFHPLETAVEDLSSIAEPLARARDAHYHLARAYIDLERPGEAKQALRRARECDPDFLPARVLQLELEGAPLESKAFRDIESECGTRGGWESWWLGAYKSVRTGSWKDALAGYRRILTLREVAEPYIGCFIEARLGIGVAFLEAGKYVDAVESLSVARDQVKGLETDLLLAKAHYLRKRPEERQRAEEILGELYDRARADRRENEAALWIAALYGSLGQYEKALEYVEKLEDLPIQPRLEAFFLYQRGEIDRAMAAARNALRRNPRNPVALRILTKALLVDLRSGPAAEKLRDAVELARLWIVLAARVPQDASARGRLQAVRVELEREAYSLLKKIVVNAVKKPSARSWGPPWLRLLAWAVAGMGNTPQGYFTDVKKVSLGDLFHNKSRFYPRITPDGQTLCFSGYNSMGGTGQWDLYLAHGFDSGFPSVRNAAEINTAGVERPGCFSSDGRAFYFSSDRRSGNHDIYVATWDGERFGEPRLLGAVNSEAADNFPSISADGLELYFASDRDGGRGGFDIYVATREALRDAGGRPVPFGNVENLAEINSSYNESEVSLSADGRTLFWGDTWADFRPEGLGNGDVWMATRPDGSHRSAGGRVPFRNIQNLDPPVNSGLAEGAPCITGGWPHSGSKLFFYRIVGTPEKWKSWIYEATWVQAAP